MMKTFLLFVFCSFTMQVLAQHKDIPATSAFVVTGAVKKELRLSAADIAGMKQEILGDIVLHSHKTDTAKQMKGVLLKTIIDSAGVSADNPKVYNDMVIVLTAADGYKNVYSWNELYNTDIGDHVYIITEVNGKNIDQMPDRIMVLSLSDVFSGRRHLKGLTRIEVKNVE